MRFVKENRWSRTALVLICIAIATFLLTVAPRNEVFADDNELAAVFRSGSLEVNVPNEPGTANNHTLSIEILDPNDKLVARVVRSVSSSDNRALRVTVPLDKSIALEDLAWDRLKINAGDSSKIVSISEILRVPVVRIFAQRAYAAGSPASVRIITVDSKAGNPLRDSRVKLELVNADRATTLFAGRTDSLGTAQVSFTLPADSYGSRQLRVTADTSLGTVTANQPIQLERRDRILLTTDKPLYQPGQTIHLRALALDGPSTRQSPINLSRWKSRTAKATRSSRSVIAPIDSESRRRISSLQTRSTSGPITFARSWATQTRRLRRRRPSP